MTGRKWTADRDRPRACRTPGGGVIDARELHDGCGRGQPAACSTREARGVRRTPLVPLGGCGSIEVARPPAAGKWRSCGGWMDHGGLEVLAFGRRLARSRSDHGCSPRRRLPHEPIPRLDGPGELLACWTRNPAATCRSCASGRRTGASRSARAPSSCTVRGRCLRSPCVVLDVLVAYGPPLWQRRPAGGVGGALDGWRGDVAASHPAPGAGCGPCLRPSGPTREERCGSSPPRTRAPPFLRQSKRFVTWRELSLPVDSQSLCYTRRRRCLPFSRGRRDGGRGGPVAHGGRGRHVDFRLATLSRPGSRSWHGGSPGAPAAGSSRVAEANGPMAPDPLLFLGRRGLDLVGAAAVSDTHGTSSFPGELSQRPRRGRRRERFGSLWLAADQVAAASSGRAGLDDGSAWVSERRARCLGCPADVGRRGRGGACWSPVACPGNRQPAPVRHGPVARRRRDLVGAGVVWTCQGRGGEPGRPCPGRPPSCSSANVGQAPELDAYRSTDGGPRGARRSSGRPPPGSSARSSLPPGPRSVRDLPAGPLFPPSYQWPSRMPTSRTTAA